MKLFHETSDTHNEVESVQTIWVGDFKVRVSTSRYKPGPAIRGGSGEFTKVYTSFFNGLDWVTVFDWKKLPYEHDISALHRTWAEKTGEFLRA